MTNREWLESLTDHQLAEFLTVGLKCSPIFGGSSFLVSIEDIIWVSIEDIRRGYTQSVDGIEKWLESPQCYEVYVSEKENKNDE